MTQISAVDNNSFASNPSAGTFLATLRGIAAPVSETIVSLIAATEEKRAATIKYSLLGAFSVVGTGVTMRLFGIAMNCAFNHHCTTF